MSLPLRFFVLLCGCTPLAVVLVNLAEINQLMPTPLIPMGMIFAFAALSGGCIRVLFGSDIAGLVISRPRSSTV